MHWTTTRFDIDLGQPRVMGIVNATPDSFSDGGRPDPRAWCDRLVAEGADILDIGGESSRPGAEPVPADEEWRRIEPVLRHALTLGVPVSVDTAKPGLMWRALDLGADIVNDITALRAPGAAELLAGHARAGICLMHMRGEPRSMQQAPEYADVVAEVAAFLAAQVGRLAGMGIAAARIVADPGIGFGKTAEHNLTLLRRQQELATGIGVPLLVGWSRKSTLGSVTGRPVDQRLAASLAAALIAVQRGARIVRVHDVGATVDMLRVWQQAG